MYDDENEGLQEEQLEQRRKRRAELKRQRILKQRLLYVGAAAVLIIIIILIARGCGADGDENPGASASISPDIVTDDNPSTGLQTMGPVPDNKTPVSSAPAQTTNITLTAVGDIMIYKEQLDDAYNAASNTYDFSNMFKYISKYTLAGDLTIGNLETNMVGGTGGNTYQGYPNFNSPESLAENLADIGFDIMSTANTYSIQNLISGLVSTIRNVRGAGIDNVGTYFNQDERDSTAGGIVVKEVRGLRIGFMAYTKGTNNIMLPSGQEYAVNIIYKDYYTYYSEIDRDAILSDLEAAESLDLDLLVALMHWGSEFEDVNSDQTGIAELLLSNGVDIILGSHSHILQKLETQTITKNGQDSEAFIAYSLGNFTAFQQDRKRTDETIILNIEIAVDDETGAVTIADVNYIPVYILDRGSGASDRFVLLDIHAAMASYESGDASIVNEEQYTKLQSALDSIHSAVGAEYDMYNS